MAVQGKAATAIPPQPARYSDIMAKQAAADENDVAPRSAKADGAAGTARPIPPEPASASGGGINPVGGTFDREKRDDLPGDRDRKGKRVHHDLISRQLGFEIFETGASFMWCADGSGRPLEFSRCYRNESVLIDLFPGDSIDIRDEVALKRAAILAHNVEAEKLVEAIKERVPEAAAKRVEHDAKQVIKGKTLEQYEQDELNAGMIYLQNTGQRPFGYLPLIGPIPVDVDVEALLLGEVFDLPEPVEEIVPGGGDRIIRH